MRVYLTQTSDINNSAFTSQDVITAYIAQKKENGYIVNIGGTEIFAHCLLDLNIGDFLKLKVAESSASQIVFKVVQHEAQISQAQPEASMSLDVPHTFETHAALNLLSKLNLPIKKERLSFIIDLFEHLIRDEKQEPLLPSAKELPLQTPKLLFHKALANSLLNKQHAEIDKIMQKLNITLKESLVEHIGSDPTILKDKLLELLQDFPTLKDEASIFNKTMMHNRTKTSVIKEYLAFKALNLLHHKDSESTASFYAVPIPIYHNIYLKISEDHSHDNTQAQMYLTFIINTKNLGAVLVNLIYINGEITASSTFEDKKALDMVKKALDINKNIQGLIKTMKLQVGKVSLKDFLFGEIKAQPIITGINLKV